VVFKTKVLGRFLWQETALFKALHFAVINLANRLFPYQVIAGKPMNIRSTRARVKRALGKLNHHGIIACAFLAIGFIEYLDYLIGPAISLSIFHVFPVAFATWCLNSKGGLLIAMVSMTAMITAGNYGLNEGIGICNQLLYFGFLLLVVFALNRLQAYFAHEQKLARTDAVTGVPNRRAFFEYLQYCFKIAAREQMPVSLAYIDLDDFKRINDQYGHSEGDRLLGLVARTLAKSIRGSDFLARFGGDEFALALSGTNRIQAEIVMEKLRQELRQAFVSENAHITCSIGCVSFNALIPSIEEAIHAADSVMYQVKYRGKDGADFVVFDVKFSDTAETLDESGSHQLPI